MEQDSMFFARDAVFNPEESGLNSNLLVVGSSGTGKTMSIIAPRLLHSKSDSLIVTVAKRTIVRKYSQLLQKRGYRVLDLNLVDPSGSSCGFDPMNYCFSGQDLMYLANSILLSNPRKEHSAADPYWDDMAATLLTAVMELERAENPNASLADVVETVLSLDLLQSSPVSSGADQRFRKPEYRNTGFVRKWNTFRSLPLKTASCSYSALTSALNNLFSDEMLKMMRNGTYENVDFRKLSTERTVLFVTTGVADPILNRFTALFFSLAFKTLFSLADENPDGKLNRHVAVMYDDFGAGGCALQSFSEFLSVSREKSISITVLLQDETQLEAVYGRQTGTIISNFDSYVFMGSNDLLTCEHIARRLSTKIDEVLYIPLGAVIVFRRGSRPLYSVRYPLTQDELYQKEMMQNET